MVVAVIKIRVPKPCDVSVDLDAPISLFLDVLVKEYGFEHGGIKLILKGKSICLDDAQKTTPRSVGIVDNSALMAMKVAKTVEVNTSRDEESKLQELAKLNETSEKLAARSDAGYNDQVYFAITNQDGQELRLPESDRKGIIRAMTLQEKANAAMGKDDDMAFQLFLLATEALEGVDKKVIEMVDNFGILYLDMVWIMFKKKDISNVAKSTEWLLTAEKCLIKAHGVNMERVQTIRGGLCTEKILYVRLYLLQGVLAMMNGNSALSEHKLLQARNLCDQFMVSDEQVSLLMSMLEISAREARRALLASGKEPNLAVQYALQRREKAIEMEKEERLRRQRDREQRKYGQTQSKRFVDMLLLEELCKMGFDRWVAAEALRQADNDQGITIDILMDEEKRTSILVLLEERQRKREERRQRASAAAAANEMKAEAATEALAHLMSLGFSEQQAKPALKATHGDIQAAARALLDGTQYDDTEMTDASDDAAAATAAEEEEEEDDNDDNDEDAQDDSGSSDAEAEQEEEEDDRLTREHSIEEFLKGMDGDAEKYLDMDLKEEYGTIQTYLNMLETNSSSAMAN